MIERMQASLLSRHERQVLCWLALRLPSWVTPDRLTAFGVFGAGICLVGYVASGVSVHWLWLANLGLLIHWFGDSLDGTLARVRGIERPNYGFYLDQTVDVVGNLVIALGVGLSPWVRMDSALFMLTAYHMLSIHSFVLSVVTRRFHIDAMGFGPTEMRLGIILMNLAILFFGAEAFPLLGLWVTWCDVLVCGAALVMICVFLILLYREAGVQRARDRRDHGL